MSNYSLVIHGGAGVLASSTMTPRLKEMYLKGLSDAIEAGRLVLKRGGSALEAVTVAVVSLEDCPMFNAGRGSVFTHKGTHEMDASLMEGENLGAGAVAGVNGFKNPIKLAAAVMQKTEHLLLCGKEAELFGIAQGLETASPDYFFNELRHQQWLALRDTNEVKLDHAVQVPNKKMGTVGAVACDMFGHLAAATSTGGMTNKKYGRVGDTPIIGAGTYANNKTCAVSCTGHGEFFMKAVVAYDVSCLMEYKGLSLQEACDYVIKDKLVKIGGEGGLIAVDKNGNISMPYNSEGMYRACGKNEEPSQLFIYESPEMF
ncbi:MAG: isoaspartyl peptidase/L-asparaginase [Cytophagales bacterium]|nr:MAG: isoaspartyl peptidase/L-asparaginase [Cytophagales bacterium]TAF60189.1 MAG: isoaspartyl peptidase/L-asparaginase [Cytophagales bacterium]